MSRSGWITSILNTPFFCHRFNTRTSLLCKGKQETGEGKGVTGSWQICQPQIGTIGDYNTTIHMLIPLSGLILIRGKFSQAPSVLTLSSTGQRQRFSKVPVMFLVNLGPNTSLSAPNWCLDCLTMESTTYRPATLYSGLHWRKQEKKRDLSIFIFAEERLRDDWI